LFVYTSLCQTLEPLNRCTQLSQTLGCIRWSTFHWSHCNLQDPNINRSAYSSVDKRSVIK